MTRWLVTGAAGFIGSTFVRRLVAGRPEVEVVAVDKLTYAGNLDNLADLDPGRCRFRRADICDRPAVDEAMAGVEVVAHFAAETHVDRSLLDPVAFARTDVEGTLTLLEAARRAGVRRFLHVSTDEVYGSRPSGAFTEQDRCEPRNPYSASKLGGERLAWSYHQSHGLGVVIVRPSNNFGPRQHVEKLIPLFITNALLDQPLPLYGDGENVRDWLFVDDCCQAVELLVERGQPGEVYNLPGGNERSNRVVTESILALLGKDKGLIRPVADRPGHDRRYAIDGGKLAALGFVAPTRFEQGLERTVRWYRDHPEWWGKVRNEDFRRYYRRQYGDR